MGELDPSRSITGEMVGSPNYVSPEQCRGDRDVDGRADVWSMGMVFYKCLAGAVAYAAPTTSMLLAKIIYEEPTPLAELAPSLPRDLAAVIQRAVVKDRAQRWSSMAEFAAAVRGCALWRGARGGAAGGGRRSRRRRPWRRRGCGRAGRRSWRRRRRSRW